MSGNVMSYKVINLTMQELLSRLITSIPNGGRATFEATSTDDPSEQPAIQHFDVRVEPVHANTPPLAMDVIDKDGSWFQIVLHDDGEPVEFEIITI